MKRTIKSIVTLVAVAVAGVSCLQLEQPGLNEILSGDEIVFGADAYIEAETKASSGTTETTSLTSFYVSAVTGSAGSESSAFNSTQFTQVTGSSPAVYTGGKMWAATDQSWKFYASNVPLTFHADGTTVAATNTTDVVCAYLTDGTYKTKNTLTFEHIFARFGRVDVAAESGYTISNISIRITPKTGGTYNLRTGAGQTDGSGWSSVTTGSATVVANQVGANGNDIYLVPGIYQVTATWTATQSGTSITYTDKVVNVPIVGGKTNVVSVVLGGEVTFGVDLQEYCDYDYRDNLDYLTFYCDEAGTIGWSYFNTGSARTIQYSKDFGKTWNSLTSTSEGATFSVSAGDIVWFKGSESSYSMNHFTATNKFHVYGNINSLLNWNNTFATTHVFQGLFYQCSNLYTYQSKKIVLPTTTMTNSCYNNLFYGCSSMEYSPELPATTMDENCYSSMFQGCTSLVKAPDLPATVAAPKCYYSMFEGCTSLKVAPVISATVLAQQCCTCMFKDCTSLTEPPVLPATTLAEECYGGMFQSCTSLVKAPDLPATVMAPTCYYYMFSRCSSLNVAPVISATVLAQECCYGMFNKCTALTVAPELPATTLAEECYTGMFQYCSSLVKAPELPATALVSKCYSWMFFSCSSLNYIKAMFTTTPSDSYTEGWVDGVAARGTFVKSAAATWNVTGTDGVPTGWSVMAETPGPGQWMDNPDNYLRFKFVTDGQVNWQKIKGDIQYSKNGGAWTAFNGAFVSMSAGDEIWFKGDLTSGMGTNSESTSSRFFTSGKFYVSGNVQSLCSFNNTLQDYHFGYLFYKCAGLNIDDNFPLTLPATTLAKNCYYTMFGSCTSLTSAPELPATTLASACYSYMFSNCSSLTSVPELPATTLVSSCYSGMFNYCSSLTTAPELPATTLADYCYQGMFYGCSSLTTAPELPATTLASSCYSNMFSSCSSLTSAPELPATTMMGFCYSGMFRDCSLLTSAPELPATTLANYCYQNLFYGCTSLTSVPELPATTLASSCYYYMFYGCTSLTTAPELPATTLASSCYYYMFYGCTSLTSVPEILPATTLASSCYYGMFYNCISLTTAPELPATTLASSCYYNMFYGCTSLTSVPEILPATTLVSSCYYGMFYNCISLTTAPELPATELVSSCYSGMFRNCRSLNYIKALFITTPSSSYTSYWVYGVASTGTFLMSSNATWFLRGENGIPMGWTDKKVPVPIGKFTINVNGDQVGFARGNLRCTIASGPDATGYNYVGTDWCFAANQWEYLGSTDSANTFTVGKKMDLFGWVGESASYDTYGLCSNTGTNNAYYGTDGSDALKTDWGDIPGVVSYCGVGWFTLSNDEWGYVFNTRTTGNTVNGTPDARYTEAIINIDATGVNGIILFPDDYSAGTPSGVTWGTINAASAWGTQCTRAGWSSLQAAGCVFIPAAGYREGGGVDNVGGYAYYWSSSPGGVDGARDVRFGSGRVNLQYEGHRLYGFSVRLAKRVN